MEFNPVWIGVVISFVGLIATGFVAYHASLRGTAVALARFDERQTSMGRNFERLQNEQDAHSDLLSDHGERLAVIERVIDLRSPPLDYVKL